MNIVRAAGFEHRRRHIVGAAPDLDLFGTDPVDHLLLVEAGQPAIVALIEVPVLGHRKPEAAHFPQRQVERSNGAGQYAGEAAVEIEASLGQQRAGPPGSGYAGVAEVDVPPAGEPVLKVPLRLAVPQKHQRRHQAGTISRALPAVAAAFSSGRIPCSASRQDAARNLERCGDQPYTSSGRSKLSLNGISR